MKCTICWKFWVIEWIETMQRIMYIQDRYKPYYNLHISDICLKCSNEVDIKFKTNYCWECGSEKMWNYCQECGSHICWRPQCIIVNKKTEDTKIIYFNH